MFRIAAAALCLTASAASADQLVGFVHTHVDGYTGSYSTPFNYRPNRATDFVRHSGFNEANSRYIKAGRVGKTEGRTVSTTEIFVSGGAPSGGAQVQMGQNLPRY